MRKFNSILFAGASLLVLGAGSQAEVAAETSDLSNAETVIVTGTRFTGTTALDSAAPISVIGGAELAKVGQPDLVNALNRTVPSFNAEAQGYDLSWSWSTASGATSPPTFMPTVPSSAPSRVRIRRISISFR